MILTHLMLSTLALADPKMEVRMHDRSVAGQSIELTIRITNPDTEAVSIPDLSNRPWLVQFQTTDPMGTKRTVHSTPPPEDPGTTLLIAPGEMRETRFQVPTSGAWSTGTARISVIFQNEPIGSHTVTLVTLPPSTEADQAYPVDQTIGPPSHLWGVHRGTSTDLFVGDGTTNEFLSSVPGRVRPKLSIARIEQHIGRWITWTDPSTGGLWVVQQDAHGLQGSPTQLHLPWPGAAPCGRGATDHSGRLVIPVCVPSPNGQTTQLVAAVHSHRSEIQFRTMAPFKPAQVLTNVDSSGSVEFVLIRPTAIDWAHLGSDPSPTTRPVRIERVWRSQGPERILSASLKMGTGTPPSPEVQFSLNDGSAPLSRTFAGRQ